MSSLELFDSLLKVPIFLGFKMEHATESDCAGTGAMCRMQTCSEAESSGD